MRRKSEAVGVGFVRQRFEWAAIEERAVDSKVVAVIFFEDGDYRVNLDDAEDAAWFQKSGYHSGPTVEVWKPRDDTIPPARLVPSTPARG